jgi:hypothetical protein
MKLYSLSSKLDFGEFKGQTLKEVFLKDPEYIETCILDNPTFCFNENTLEKLEDMHPEFVFSDEAAEKLEEKYEIYEEEENEFDEAENFPNDDIKNLGVVDNPVDDDYDDFGSGGGGYYDDSDRFGY